MNLRTFWLINGIEQAKAFERDLIGRTKAPFFAHNNVPMMTNFSGNFMARYPL